MSTSEASTALPVTSRYPKALNPAGVRPANAPRWIDAIDNPYLHGLFAPTTVEAESTDLPVDGELPRELNGAYFRNGPNSRHAPTNRYHWFDGDGMIHGIWFEDGKARYRNRWVQTPAHQMEHDKGESIWPGVLGPFDFTLPFGPIKDTANTDLVFTHGRLLALWYESGGAFSLDPNTLETRGVERFDEALPRRISAHSKQCPQTGDFIWFSYSDRPPFMRYGVYGADGRTHQVDITLPGPRRPHDIGVTPNVTVLHDFPVFFDPELFKKTKKRIPVFHRDVPTRFGLIPRWGQDAEVQWFEFSPCYMLHVVNCWEEGDEVVMIGCRTDDPTLRPNPEDGRIAAMLSGLKVQANLYEWRMNRRTGATSERHLDDLNAEFPMMNPAASGHRARYSYHAILPFEVPATFDGIVKYDLQTGDRECVYYGEGIFGSEAPFVASAAADPATRAEDDGYLVTFVTDARDWKSACWVYRADDLQAGPIAKVALPHRIPSGFHATWVDGADLNAA